MCREARSQCRALVHNFSLKKKDKHKLSMYINMVIAEPRYRFLPPLVPRLWKNAISNGQPSNDHQTDNMFDKRTPFYTEGISPIGS